MKVACEDLQEQSMYHRSGKLLAHLQRNCFVRKEGSETFSASQCFHL